MPLVLIGTERFAEHQTPSGHPESPERAEVLDAVIRDWRKTGGEVRSPRAATRDQLVRVHDPEYVRRIAEVAGTSVALDADTYTSPESYDVATLAAGAAVDAVECVVGGSSRRAFALVRPPGHHAERGRAMGFCLFNNVAVAAAHARSMGLERVAIVDYDVHHGNGTQHMFEADPSVLYVSLHQWPYYPGTGAAHEVGLGNGAGFTVNVPLAAGAVDEDYRMAFGEVVLPVLRQFAPQLLFISAGFDAHERDPLAGMRLTTPAYAAMTASLCQVADATADGRVVAVTEGGYDLDALGESIRAAVGALSASRPADIAWPKPGGVASNRAERALTTVRPALAPYWRL